MAPRGILEPRYIDSSTTNIRFIKRATSRDISSSKEYTILTFLLVLLYIEIFYLNSY
jgi:hypothetical protein